MSDRDDILDSKPLFFRPQERIVDSDPVTGMTTKFYVDADGKFHVWDEQEVDPIVTLANEEYKETGRSRFGDFAKVASIPLAIWSKLEKAGITRDDKTLKKWLNDPDNRAFRTRPGRI